MLKRSILSSERLHKSSGYLETTSNLAVILFDLPSSGWLFFKCKITSSEHYGTDLYYIQNWYVAVLPLTVQLCRHHHVLWLKKPPHHVQHRRFPNRSFLKYNAWRRIITRMSADQEPHKKFECSGIIASKKFRCYYSASRATLNMTSTGFQDFSLCSILTSVSPVRGVYPVIRKCSIGVGTRGAIRPTKSLFM